MSSPSVPLQTVPATIVEQLVGFGAPPELADHELYRSLANNPDQLVGWIEMAWRLRQLSETSARLRELMIVRGSQLADCALEVVGHTHRARLAGVGDEVIDELASWRTSTRFSEEERVAFELMEEMVECAVSDETLARLAEHFSPSERIELILTAGFYVMAPRVVDALRLTPDPD